MRRITCADATRPDKQERQAAMPLRWHLLRQLRGDGVAARTLLDFLDSAPRPLVTYISTAAKEAFSVALRVLMRHQGRMLGPSLASPRGALGDQTGSRAPRRPRRTAAD